MSTTILFVALTTVVAQTDEVPSSDTMDGVSAMMAADAFYMFDWLQPDPPDATAGVPHRAFDFTNGFALAFAALDLAYEGEQVGATINFRFGGGANRLIGQPLAEYATLKQAYATWKPTPKLTLDLGQFDTIYGAEVANSWENLNYTRGALYFLMQPFYHTGLRVGYSVNDMFSLTFLVVNGTNNNVDNNDAPHVGVQVGITPSENFFVALGYYGGSGSSGFGAGGDPEHFIDVVVNATLGSMTLVGNFDFYMDQNSESSYYGASLAAGFDLTETFDAAVRVEYLADPDLFISGAYESLITGTVTLDYQPVDHVIIRLDNRFESASDPVFPGSDGIEDAWFATTLGLVVTTG